MVSRDPASEQGDVPAHPVFASSPFMPLSLTDIVALVDRVRFAGSYLLVYQSLLLHCDCLGNVVGRVRDVAAAVHMETEGARRVLRWLRRHGYISQSSAGWRRTCWHIAAVRESTTPAA